MGANLSIPNLDSQDYTIDTSLPQIPGMNLPLPKRQDLNTIAELVKNAKAKSILTMTGAGISTAAGIPDFRTPGTGLYDNLQTYNLPYPEAIFDINFFQYSPEPFYALAKELYPGKFLPTKTHYFLTLLHKKELLLRAFTQNIDTLERLAGVPDDMLVEAHGSFASAKCLDCKVPADNAFVKETIRQNKIPRCTHCKTGIVKPEITFFGESLPPRFFSRITDFNRADLLIVVGTSLKVQPFASLINRVDDDTPRLVINREVLPGFDFTGDRDALWLGDCDEGVERLCELLGWRDELDALYAEGHAALEAKWAEEERAHEKKVEGKVEGKEEEEEEEDMQKRIEQLAEHLDRAVRLPKNAEESGEREEQQEKEREERRRVEGVEAEAERKEETGRKVEEAKVEEAKVEEAKEKGEIQVKVEVEVTTVTVETVQTVTDEEVKEETFQRETVKEGVAEQEEVVQKEIVQEEISKE